MKNTVFLGILLLTSCAGKDIIQLIDYETFEIERRLWLEQDLQNYSFHIQHDHHPLGFKEGTVIVKDGALYAYIGNELTIRDYRSFFADSISRIYDLISDSYDYMANAEYGNGSWRRRGWQHYKQEIEYDDAHHFPKYYYSFFSHSDLAGRRSMGNWASNKLFITNFTPNPPELEALSFNRENFERERQSWLEQDLQNYSFSIVLESKEYIPNHGMKELYWSGSKVVIRDGALFSYSNLDRGGPWRFLNENNPDYPPPPDLEKWVTSISEIFDHIIYDSQDNAGLNLGIPWRTEMKVWRERFEGHPDSIAYTYRDYRCLLALSEPSATPEIFGLYKSFNLFIGNLNPIN